jgi:hypothetical protein
MTYAKRWIMAGATAALLGGSAHAAARPMGAQSGGDGVAAGPRTVRLTGDGQGFQGGFVAAEAGAPVQLVLPPGQPVTVTVRPEAGGIGYSSERQADRAAVDDAAEIAAGNSGGRG